jgi:GT2 family glycosyltransferase
MTAAGAPGSAAGPADSSAPAGDAPLPFVTIAVPVRDEAATLGPCLEAIRAQDYPPERVQILVVDGASRDGSRAVAARVAAGDPRITILDNPSGRVAAALNLALDAALGEFLVRIDAHALVAADYVRRSIDLLRRTGADNVGGPMAPRGDSPLGEAIARAMRSRFGVGPARFRYARRVEEVDTVYLGAYPKALFERVGRFNEELVRNQDYEMNYRIRKAGGRILVDPAIRSTYRVRPDLPSLWRQFWSYGYWKPQMLRRHPRSLRARQLAAPALVGAMVLGLAAAVAAALTASPAPVALALAMAATVAAYVLASCATALVHGFRGAWTAAPRLPAVFATMHLAWGAGFWLGLLRPPRNRERAGSPR